MKKYLAGLLSVAVVTMAGCGSDSTPLTPGDPMNSDYQEFSQQFDAMDQGVGLMGEMAFQSLDLIFAQSPQSGRVVRTASDFAFQSPQWDDASNTWSVSLTYDDGQGTTFSATNSIQIFEGTQPVQYPSDALTEIKSSLTMEAGGDNFHYSATQNLSMKPGINNIVSLNGDGSFDLSLTADIQTDAGTSTCTFSSKFTTLISNVAIMNGDISSSCPVGGHVRFSGLVSSACTGSTSGSGSRSWAVTRTWDETGASTTDFVSGGNVWSVEEPCS